MQTLTGWQDRMAIGLSVACTLHCLFVPILLLLFPTITGNLFISEQVHKALLLVAVPISFFALSSGCQVHRKVLIGATGAVGLLVLTGSAFFGHEVFEGLPLGEYGERAATLMGTALMIYSHLKNLKLCRENKHCC